MGKKAEQIGIAHKKFCPSVALPPWPPWLLPWPEVDISLLDKIKIQKGRNCGLMASGYIDKHFG